jgi:hypothetical protein
MKTADLINERCCVGCFVSEVVDDNGDLVIDSHGEQSLRILHGGCCDTLNQSIFVHTCDHQKVERYLIQDKLMRERVTEESEQKQEGWEFRGEFMAYGEDCGGSGIIRGNFAACLEESLCVLNGTADHLYCDRDVWELVSHNGQEGDLMQDVKVYEVVWLGYHRKPSVE